MSSKTRWILVVGVAIIAMPTLWWAAGQTGDVPDAVPSLSEEPATPLVSPTPVPSAGSPRPVFPRDACVSFSPSRGQARGTVFLDAGHGGIDPGGIGRTTDGREVIEKHVTLDIVNVAVAKLRDAGYRVVVSRVADTVTRIPGPDDVNGEFFTPWGVRRDVLARIACANAAAAQVLVSVHMNSFTDPREGGSLTLFNPERPFAAANRRLATIVQTRIVKSLHEAGWYVQDRSIVKDTDNQGGALSAEGARYGREILLGPASRGFVDVPSAMPGVVVEPLFLTRPEEADIVASAKGVALLGTAVATAIQEFLSGA